MPDAAVPDRPRPTNASRSTPIRSVRSTRATVVPSDDLITLYEAAERLGVHYMTVYRYVRTGRLPGRKVGVEWRVDLADLDTFAASSASAATGFATSPAPSGRPAAPATGSPTDSDSDTGSATSSPTTSRRRRVDYHRRLVERLIAGDEAGSWAIVQSALGAGIDPADIYLDVIGPALTVIGDEWAEGRLTIGQEHQASGVVFRLIGRMGPLFARRGRKRGTVVIGAPAGDHHRLPSALFADLLRGIGLAVVDLGSDTPTQSFVETARHVERLVAIAISATSPDDDAAITAVVDAVRSVLDVPIVLGGIAIDSEERSIALGADHWAPDTRRALDLFAELADDASRARRRDARRDTRREAP